jgi:vacuolar protein sorting-associated protein 13A/C
MFIKYATILLQSMAVEIDQDIVYAFLDFAKFEGASWQESQQE